MKSKKKLFFGALFIFLTCYLFIFLSISTMEPSVEGWGYNTTRETRVYISTMSSSQILPPNFCKDSTFLVMMICSAPKNFDERQAIRTTWAKETQILGKNISHFFLLGKTGDDVIQNHVEKESNKYGDIIVENFKDSYNNLTLKSIIMLKLATIHCSNTTKYILKIDDDIFLNTDLLVRVLVTRNNTANLLLGKLICGAKPIKDTSSKWYSPNYMYRGRVYPKYVSGTSYAMSIDIAKKLYKTTLTTPIFHLEDVYITGICAKKANIKILTNSLMTYDRVPNDICVLRKLISAHRFSPERIRKTYALLKVENLEKECNLQNNIFSVNHWIIDNILKVNKTYRKVNCV